MNGQWYERSTDALQALLWSRPSPGDVDPSESARLTSAEREPEISRSCAACGATARTVEPESPCNEIESKNESGWTYAPEESYCPICADVRARTWGDSLADNEPKG